jgi:hypothetical protein
MDAVVVILAIGSIFILPLSLLAIALLKPDLLNL